jgi:two-component system, NarL family, response regulator LiaR
MQSNEHESDDHEPTRETPLRVIVADDDPLVRRVIRDILQQRGITIVAEASNGRDAVRMARHYKPDIVLLDVIMPGLDGLSALEQITADERIQAKVVMLSVRGEHDVAFLALRKGALGYLNKDVDLAVLPRVLRDVANGEAALSRSFTTHLVKRLRDLPEGGVGMRPVQSTLTAREWEVADLLCLGKRTDEIADTLVLTTETVRTHVKNIMRKLDVHSRADLIGLVEHLRSGLVQSSSSGAVPSDQLMLSQSAA